MLIDEDGARVRHKTFTPFGAEHAAVGALLSERTYYAGHRRHDDTGLYYMQARWMDPNAGTFLGIDPLVPSAADPQSHNSYAYARNNPIAYDDPSGACIFRHCGDWYGGVPDGMAPSQFGNATLGSTYMSVTDPSGQGPGGYISLAQAVGAFASYPSLSKVFSAVANFFSSESEGISSETALVSIRRLSDRFTEYTYVPKDTLNGRDAGVFVDKALTGVSAIGVYGEFSRVRGGMWLGANNKWYSLTWGGNGSTRARSLVVARAAQFRAIARGSAYVQGIMGLNDLVSGDTSLARTSGAFDIGMAYAFSAGGLPGAALGLGLGISGVGFADFVSGIALLSEGIINAGPNGPLR